MRSTDYKRSSHKGRLWMVLILILASAGVAIAFTLFRHKESISYFTESVERGNIKTVVNATGTLQPVVTVQVGSQVSGQIEAIYADYNSIVKRGQLLAKIDPRNFQAQVEDAEANLAAAKAREESARADLNTMQANLVSADANLKAAAATRDNDALTYKRYQEMTQSGIIAQNDYDTVKTTAENSAAKYNQAAAAVQQAKAQIDAQKAQIQQAIAQVQQAKADLDSKRVNLEYTNIFSPVDGVVISRNVDVGQTVAAGLQAPLLFVIANDLTHMQVNASIDEADIGHISMNVPAKFTVDAFPNRTFTGNIEEVRLDPQTVQNVVTYSVILGVDNRDLYLKPGMTANITITVGIEDNVLKIPNAALRYHPQGVAASTEATESQGQEHGLPAGAEYGRNSSTRTHPVMSDQGKEKRARPGHNPANQAATCAGNRILWNPSDKIRFPALPAQAPRRSTVWILDKNKKPEQQTVFLGITDGAYTELVSGPLKEGEPLIVADTSEESARSGQSMSAMRSPFSTFGRRR